MASNIEIRITAKDGASKEIKNLQKELTGLGKAADDMTRKGANFSTLGKNIDEWSSALKASTPQNMRFAESFASITSRFQDGTLTSKEATSQLAELKKEMENARPAAEKFAAGFSAMVKQVAVGVGVVAAAGIAFKKAMDFGEQGAAIAQTEMSFNSMIKTIGADVEILNKLKEASGGTLSDLTLMSATTTLLAGTSKELGVELANNAPQIMEIAKAANKLNPTMGTTEYMYESLMKGIKRGSPMIIDNTGLIIKIGEANEAYAASIGKTVEQLTAEEKKVALMTEVMRAGNNLIEQVGGNTDSMTDSFARLDTATTNLANSMKKKLAPGLADVAEAAAEMITYSEDTSNQMSELEMEVRKTSASYDEYFQKLKETSKEQNISFMLMGAVSEAQYNETRALEAAAAARSMYNVNIQQVNDLTQQQIEKELAAEQAWLMGQQAVLQYDTELSALRTEMGMSLIGLENLSASLKNNTSSTGYAQAAIAQLNQAFQNGEITSIEYAKGLDGINTQFGLTTPKSDAMAIGMTSLNQAAVDGRLPWEDLGRVQEEWRTSVNNGQTDLDTFLNKVGIETPTNMDRANTAINENTEYYRILKEEGLSPVERSLQNIWSFDGKKVEMDVVVNYAGGGPPGGGIGTPKVITAASRSFDSALKAAGIGGRASGGSVTGGKTVLVGERGPELFTPPSNGYITPNHELGGVTLHVHYSPAISLATEHEVKNTLLPFVRDALRNI